MPKCITLIELFNIIYIYFLKIDDYGKYAFIITGKFKECFNFYSVVHFDLNRVSRLNSG